MEQGEKEAMYREFCHVVLERDRELYWSIDITTDELTGKQTLSHKKDKFDVSYLHNVTWEQCYFFLRGLCASRNILESAEVAR